MTTDEAQTIETLVQQKKFAESKAIRKEASTQLKTFHENHVGHTVKLTEQLEKYTGIESRLTILGHLQRGGTPSAADRILATRLGTACAELLHNGVFGVMLAVRGDGVEPLPLNEVAGKKKLVPLDHPWVSAARLTGVCLGDAAP